MGFQNPGNDESTYGELIRGQISFLTSNAESNECTLAVFTFFDVLSQKYHNLYQKGNKVRILEAKNRMAQKMMMFRVFHKLFVSSQLVRFE